MLDGVSASDVQFEIDRLVQVKLSLLVKCYIVFPKYSATEMFGLAGSEFIVSLGLWFVRAFVSSLICLLIGYIGIRLITLFTTKIKEFESIKGNSLATSLFVGGFFIYAGLVIYGSMVNPFFLSQSVNVGAYFNLQRLLVVVISFFVSLFFGGLFYLVFAKLKPFGNDLDDINKHPVAVGTFLFCYEVFLGLIMLASLTLPMG